MLTVVTLAAAVNVSASSDDLIPTFNDRLRDALGQLEIDGDFDAAAARVGATFDLAIASVPGGTEPERTVLRDCAFACRFVDLLADADPACRTDLTAFLLDNLDLARSVAFVTRSRSRQTRNATLAVLDRLRRERGSKLNTYATLAAAICVVHDRPVTMRVNENVARAPDPVHVFDYYATLEDRMFYGVRKVPAELLVYVVDVAASIDEMTWALDRYGGDGRVGKRFFEIEYEIGRAHV